ncbi:MAG: hypothetical protein AAF153_02190 [Pseudomonadota bacterium]
MHADNKTEVNPLKQFISSGLVIGLTFAMIDYPETVTLIAAYSCAAGLVKQGIFEGYGRCGGVIGAIAGGLTTGFLLAANTSPDNAHIGLAGLLAATAGANLIGSINACFCPCNSQSGELPR